MGAPFSWAMRSAMARKMPSLRMHHSVEGPRSKHAEAVACCAAMSSWRSVLATSKDSAGKWPGPLDAHCTTDGGAVGGAGRIVMRLVTRRGCRQTWRSVGSGHIQVTPGHSPPPSHPGQQQPLLQCRHAPPPLPAPPPPFFFFFLLLLILLTVDHNSHYNVDKPLLLFLLSSSSPYPSSFNPDSTSNTTTTATTTATNVDAPLAASLPQPAVRPQGPLMKTARQCPWPPAKCVLRCESMEEWADARGYLQKAVVQLRRVGCSSVVFWCTFCQWIYTL